MALGVQCTPTTTTTTTTASHNIFVFDKLLKLLWLNVRSPPVNFNSAYFSSAFFFFNRIIGERDAAQCRSAGVCAVCKGITINLLMDFESKSITNCSQMPNASSMTHTDTRRSVFSTVVQSFCFCVNCKIAIPRSCNCLRSCVASHREGKPMEREKKL